MAEVNVMLPPLNRIPQGLIGFHYFPELRRR
jgi:hypothetical protein